jgi:hypothetical protein
MVCAADAQEDQTETCGKARTNKTGQVSRFFNGELRMENSYVRNSVLLGRPGETLFRDSHGEVVACLDGYVIIPKEQIEDLEEFLASRRVATLVSFPV